MQSQIHSMVTWVVICAVHSFNVGHYDTVYEIESKGKEIIVSPKAC